jgi:hypothetical protein
LDNLIQAQAAAKILGEIILNAELTLSGAK